MRVSAKADYAVRAIVEIAKAGGSETAPLKGDRIAVGQQIPPRFLETILGELRQDGLVSSRDGDDGGYWLAKPAGEITIAETIRAVEGPLATVRGTAADEVVYNESAAPLKGVWVALSTNVSAVLDAVTLADVVAGDLPEPVRGLSAHGGATA